VDTRPPGVQFPRAVKPESPELLVFDCDGVLVDSETIACRVDVELFAAIGIRTSFEEIRDRFVGSSSGAMCETLSREHGVALPDGFRRRLLDAVLARFETDLAAIPGIPDALAKLPQPRCVASSSEPHRIRRSLELTGLLAHFDPHLFSAQMVERGKPAPDLFLHAAARMGVAPERALAIEDSVTGVTAARAAGMTVLGFAGGGHCGPRHDERLRAAGAAAVFRDMAELPRLVAARGAP
jgi:HAD superfamily hydrolase (TIGR01509 family)